MSVPTSYRTIEQIRLEDTVSRIRTLIWVYFWLLIFEGALRKWILPELARPLLIIRDPVLLIIYYLAMQKKILPFNGMMVWLGGVGLLTLLISFFADQGNIIITLYGFRVDFLHFPLAFIMMYALRHEDIMKIGRMFMWLVFPMAILMMFQFISPPSAWINTTAGGEGQQIRATIGNIRPPGTFSFITGVAEFLPIVTAFVVYGALGETKPRAAVMTFATIGLLGACVVSISRLALTGVCFVLLIGGIVGTMRTKRIVRLFISTFFIIFIVMMLLQFDIVRLGFSTFGDRIQAAGGSEGGWYGFLKRVTKVFYDAVLIFPNLDWLGEGLGMGTQGGAALLYGKRAYLFAEGEWSRVIIEGGPILGTAFLFWRISLTALILLKSISCLKKGDMLPILLFSTSAPLLLIGQIGRATTLGFTVFSTGLCLAAIATSEQNRGKFAD